MKPQGDAVMLRKDQGPTRIGQGTRHNGVSPHRRDPITFTQMITPAEAAHILDTMKYEHQRPPRPSKAQDYANEMIAGRFRDLTQIFIAIYHGQYVLLDGQHRLRAVVSSGIPHLFTVVEKEVESEEELARIYSTTDQGIRRTAGDIYGAHALGQEFGLNKNMLDAFGAGIKFMLNGCLYVNATIRPDAIIPHMRLYAPYVQTYQALLSEVAVPQGMYAQCKRSSTIAAALLSLRFSALKAEQAGRATIVRDFWVGMLKDDGLRQGDPRKAANQHLTITRTTPSRATRQSHVVSQSYSIRYLGNCLNAYIRGEPLRYAKVMDEAAPISIYGVPSDPALWW
jgi:hypothetical protein